MSDWPDEYFLSILDTCPWKNSMTEMSTALGITCSYEISPSQLRFYVQEMTVTLLCLHFMNPLTTCLELFVGILRGLCDVVRYGTILEESFGF